MTILWCLDSWVININMCKDKLWTDGPAVLLSYIWLDEYVTFIVLFLMTFLASQYFSDFLSQGGVSSNNCNMVFKLELVDIMTSHIFWTKYLSLDIKDYLFYIMISMNKHFKAKMSFMLFIFNEIAGWAHLLLCAFMACRALLTPSWPIRDQHLDIYLWFLVLIGWMLRVVCLFKLGEHV